MICCHCCLWLLVVVVVVVVVVKKREIHTHKNESFALQYVRQPLARSHDVFSRGNNN